MPFSIRLDPDTEARLRRLMAATGRSKAMVLREAVTRYAADWEQKDAAPSTALDRLRAYVGTVDSAGANYSDETHKKYRDALLEERRAAGPRRRQRAHRSAR
jgi:predicted DNA-binding protein